MHCFNNNYVIPAGVAFYSLLKNANSNYNYKIYVVHNDITEKNQKILSQIVSQFNNAQIEFINIENNFSELFKKTKNKSHFSKEIYYKFLAPSLFKNYDKIIVSDVDVLWLDDISKLYFDFNINEDFYIYGWRELIQSNNTQEELWKKKKYKKFPKNDYHKLKIDVGFCVFNLKKMREDNLEEKFIEYANKNLNNLFCPEQDAINVVCYPKIKFMPANAIVCSEAYKNYLKTKKCYSDEIYSKEEKEFAFNNPIQFHWATHKKVWIEECPLKDLWKEYLFKTPKIFQELYIDYLEKNSNANSKIIFSIKHPFREKIFQLIKKPLP